MNDIIDWHIGKAMCVGNVFGVLHQMNFTLKIKKVVNTMKNGICNKRSSCRWGEWSDTFDDKVESCLIKATSNEEGRGYK